ncbi:nucleotide exchange factor GrpE [Desulfuribacillus stibiiarsenatis]|uniref:Protein GrpE n=1 Tax=Desulfuribacillus stibiiarsenatis TaxID=1390249 RepID=A0A1E5L7L6_9FIRM|nr:nucleotide exchange factor GrpE [Desulfuribacillus stibiiarsenatis]OEH86140.1 nucleotide exchange factor GrpE [Desulfuribacillus stibiiarsenatis]
MKQKNNESTKSEEVVEVSNLEETCVQEECESCVDGTQDLDENQKNILQLEEKLQQQEDRYLRLQADFDNFRRRTQKDQLQVITRANKELILSILPIIDNLERAISSSESLDSPFTKGVDMVYKQLLEELKKQGVKVIEAVDKEFDPHFHQAVAQEPSDKPSNIVLEEYQKGYMLHEDVLRPTMVKVSQ